MSNKRIIIIGAGASGMMAAGRAAQFGSEVLLLEKTSEPGKKILISGKTRCNLSNSAELKEFITAYGENGTFLYSAFNRFFREDLIALLKQYGVGTKIERGGRIFPSSDDARDVVQALKLYMSQNGVIVRTKCGVKDIETHEGCVVGVRTETGRYEAGAVILAAGGSSFPETGSTGDGYKIAGRLGHHIVKIRPGLVPLVVDEVELARSMQGTSLKNVRLTAFRCKSSQISSNPVKKILINSRMGEMMITHFGLGGPLILQMSLEIIDALEKGPVSVVIDLKPALELKQLQQRLQRDLDKFGRRSLYNIAREVLPQKLIDPIIKLSGIPYNKPGSQIIAAERDSLALLMKSLKFNIKGSLPLTAAMVTAGGVDLKEIDPRTMASRLIKGLYFCGEVMDINADTGGYNLQAAFSTGYVAGESAAAYVNTA